MKFLLTAPTILQKKWTGPLISVVITNFNYGEYIEEALASVLNQTFKNFEIIVIDDGSTEPRTIEILRQLKPKIDSVGKLIFRKHEGLVRTKNYGISLARGKYICCLDADDKIERSYLEKCLKILEKDTGVGLAYSYTRLFGKENRIWTTTDLNLWTLSEYNSVPGYAVFPKKLWENLGGFNANMEAGWEDWDFWMTIAENGFRGKVIHKALCHYRKKVNSRDELAKSMRTILLNQLRKNHPRLFDRNKIQEIKNTQKYIKMRNWNINLNN